MLQVFKEKMELYSIVFKKKETWKHEERLLSKFLKSFMSGEVFKEKPSFKERSVLERVLKEKYMLSSKNTIFRQPRVVAREVN